tara:strand:+ start:922 stop:1032 length:111 start_codon:yes stop_codon:yes gene_type:complete
MLLDPAARIRLIQRILAVDAIRAGRDVMAAMKRRVE